MYSLNKFSSRPESMMQVGDYGRGVMDVGDNSLYRKLHPVNTGQMLPGGQNKQFMMNKGLGAMPDNRIWSGTSPQNMMPGSQGLEMAPMQQIPQMTQLGQHDRAGLSRFYSQKDAMVPEIELNSHHGGGGYVYFNSHFPENHEIMSDHLRPASTIGKYNPEERENLLNRFRKKRAERCYNRKVKYVSRKLLADNRPRVKGRFAKATDLGEGEQDGEVREEAAEAVDGEAIAVIGRKRKAEGEDDDEDDDEGGNKSERLESAAQAVFDSENTATTHSSEGPAGAASEGTGAPEADSRRTNGASKHTNAVEHERAQVDQSDEFAESHITEVNAASPAAERLAQHDSEDDASALASDDADDGTENPDTSEAAGSKASN
jgi:hypothetical protein